MRLTCFVPGNSAVKFEAQYSLEVVDGCADDVERITTQVDPVISLLDQAESDRSGLMLISSAWIHESDSSLTWFTSYPRMANVQHNVRGQAHWERQRTDGYSLRTNVS